LTHTSIGPKFVSTASAAASDLLVVGDVGRQHERRPTERLNLLAGSVEALLAARNQTDPRAAFGEGVRDRPPDAA